MVRLGDQVIPYNRTPVFDGARELLELGFAPGDPIAVRHAGSDPDCLAATIGRRPRCR